MLEFTEVFNEEEHISSCDIELVMKCKNIVFDHVKWFRSDIDMYRNVDLVLHLINNVVDINVKDGGDCYTLFSKILAYSRNPITIHYLLNNKCIQYSYFRRISLDHGMDLCNCCVDKQFDKLTEYLTVISLNRFVGHYNIEKYYDTLKTMLLVLKVQQELPNALIKHLIIPFIYQ